MTREVSPGKAGPTEAETPDTGSLSVPVAPLPSHEGLPLPQRMTAGAAGADLCAAVDEPLTLEAGQVVAVPTGLRLAIPDGYEGQVRPRSGLALREGITVVNAPGTIDSDYRGELKVLLTRLIPGRYTITRGERIAQLVIAPVAPCRFELRTTLDATERAEGGFGHTGSRTS